jgi:hypothetical protein
LNNAHQINGTYDCGFDACSLVSPAYGITCHRVMFIVVDTEIQQSGTFISLDRLVAHIKGDRSVVVGRATPKTMDDVKQLGDTAAHDRTYITTQVTLMTQRLGIAR